MSFYGDSDAERKRVGRIMLGVVVLAFLMLPLFSGDRETQIKEDRQFVENMMAEQGFEPEIFLYRRVSSKCYRWIVEHEWSGFFLEITIY